MYLSKNKITTKNINLENILSKQHSELFINSCIKACEKISFYIKNNMSKEDFTKDNQKGEGGDLLSKIDLFSESILVKHLNIFGDIYSEESGFIKSKTKNLIDKKFVNNLIIIDPIDGSENLFSNFPYYGSAISLTLNDNKLKSKTNLSSFVYNLCSNSYIYKTLYENNFQLTKNIYTHKPTIALFERAYQYLEVAKMLRKNKIKFRGAGAVALSLANARNYLFFLFLGSRRIFDIEAGLDICSDLHIYADDKILFVSAYKDVFDELLPKIKESMKGTSKN